MIQFTHFSPNQFIKKEIKNWRLQPPISPVPLHNTHHWLTPHPPTLPPPSTTYKAISTVVNSPLYIWGFLSWLRDCFVWRFNHVARASVGVIIGAVVFWSVYVVIDLLCVYVIFFWVVRIEIFKSCRSCCWTPTGILVGAVAGAPLNPPPSLAYGFIFLLIACGVKWVNWVKN